MCLSCRKKGRLRRPLLKKDALLGIVDPGGDSLEIPRDSLRLLASVPQIRLTLDDTEERLVYDHPSPEDDIVLTSVQNLEQLQKSVLPLGFAFMFSLVEGPREPYLASRRCTGFVRKAIIFSNESFKSTRFVRGTCFFHVLPVHGRQGAERVLPSTSLPDAFIWECENCKILTRNRGGKIKSSRE